MASLQERNGWFHLLFRYQDRQYSYALKTRDRREADAMRGSVDRSLIRIRHGELLPPPDGADVALYLLSGGKSPEPAPGAPPAAVSGSFSLRRLKESYCSAHENGALEKNSLATTRMHLGHVERHLGEAFNLQQLKGPDLQRYLDCRRQEKKLSPVTLRKEVASLRAAWNWAARSGLLQGAFPSRGLVYPKGDEALPFMMREEIERRVARGGLAKRAVAELWDCLFLTRPELSGFLTFARERSHVPFLYPMVAFAAHTGARRSELLRILIDDVDLEGGTALIREKKRVRGKRSTRRVPLSPPLREVLAAWLNRHPGGQFLFCHQGEVYRSKKRSRTTGHASGKKRPTSLKGRMATVKTRRTPAVAALTRDEAHDHFQRLIAGGPWRVLRGWHVLRHSFISICAAEGVDQRVLQSWVGHISEETHRRYLHLIPNKEREIIGRVFS
jgi:integrase